MLIFFLEGVGEGWGDNKNKNIYIFPQSEILLTRDKLKKKTKTFNLTRKEITYSCNQKLPATH